MSIFTLCGRALKPHISKSVFQEEKTNMITEHVQSDTHTATRMLYTANSERVSQCDSYGCNFVLKQ